jgi:hypothetical protein
MSEWLKEHAWKLIPAALSSAHRHAPTQSPATTSRNNDVHRTVPVNDGVCPGFQEVSDTVLTQSRLHLPPTHIYEYGDIRPPKDVAAIRRTRWVMSNWALMNGDELGRSRAFQVRRSRPPLRTQRSIAMPARVPIIVKPQRARRSPNRGSERYRSHLTSTVRNIRCTSCTA